MRLFTSEGDATHDNETMTSRTTKLDLTWHLHGPPARHGAALALGVAGVVGEVSSCIATLSIEDGGSSDVWTARCRIRVIDNVICVHFSRYL